MFQWVLDFRARQCRIYRLNSKCTLLFSNRKSSSDELLKERKKPKEENSSIGDVIGKGSRSGVFVDMFMGLAD